LIFFVGHQNNVSYDKIQKGDSGKIKDANGNLIFKVDAHFMTISERRTLEDESGTKIGTVRVKKTPGLHKTYYLGPMDNDKKCAVKAKG